MQGKATLAVMLVIGLLIGASSGYMFSKSETKTVTITKTFSKVIYTHTITTTIHTHMLVYLKLGEMNETVLFNKTLFEYKWGTILYVNFTVKEPCFIRVQWEAEYPIGVYVMSENEYKHNFGILGFYPTYSKANWYSNIGNHTILLRWPDTYYLVIYVHPQTMGTPPSFKIYYLYAAVKPYES